MRISDWSSDVCSSDLEPALRRTEIEIESITEVDVDALLLDKRKVSIIDKGIEDVTGGWIPGYCGAEWIARRWIGNVAARKRIDGLDLADRVANIDLVPVHRKIETTQEGRGEDAAKRVRFAPFGFVFRVAIAEITHLQIGGVGENLGTPT